MSERLIDIYNCEAVLYQPDHGDSVLIDEADLLHSEGAGAPFGHITERYTGGNIKTAEPFAKGSSIRFMKCLGSFAFEDCHERDNLRHATEFDSADDPGPSGIDRIADGTANAVSDAWPNGPDFAPLIHVEHIYNSGTGNVTGFNLWVERVSP